VREHSAPRLALRLQAPRLDRIVRGRAWIPVLGALLVAIVGLRVEVLKLGAGVGSQVQQATALQSSNAALRSQISALSDNSRIETLAASYGMHEPNALDPHFLQASAGRHVAAAIRNISAPSPQQYLTQLAAEEHSDQASSEAGTSLSAVGAQQSTGTGLSAGVSSTTTASTTSSVSTAPQSTSISASGNTTGLSSGGVTASGDSSTSNTGATSPPVTGSPTSGTSDTGSASLGAGSTTGTSGTAPSTASADGAAGLAG
jgi:hypothetical protein